MPTTRPRHQVTETPEVAEALDRAERWWPGEPRGRLLTRLIQAGVDAKSQGEREKVARRRAAIRESAGRFAGMYPPGYLEDLRKDWPE